MLKRSITYEDFNGETVTEDFYFNLSKSELIEIELGTEGGFSESLQRIVKEQDHGKLIKEFKKLILASYGVKSPDGKRFIKDDRLREEFSQTAAYNALFVELATNESAASTFVNAIVPADMSAAIDKGTPTPEEMIQKAVEETSTT